jgi:hypothetical protein
MQIYGSVNGLKMGNLVFGGVVEEHTAAWATGDSEHASWSYFNLFQRRSRYCDALIRGRSCPVQDEYTGRMCPHPLDLNKACEIFTA